MLPNAIGLSIIRNFQKVGSLTVETGSDGAPGRIAGKLIVKGDLDGYLGWRVSASW